MKIREHYYIKMQTSQSANGVFLDYRRTIVIIRSLVFYKLASTYVKNGSYSHLKKLAKNHKNTN